MWRYELFVLSDGDGDGEHNGRKLAPGPETLFEPLDQWCSTTLKARGHTPSQRDFVSMRLKGPVISWKSIGRPKQPRVLLSQQILCMVHCSEYIVLYSAPLASTACGMPDISSAVSAKKFASSHAAASSSTCWKCPELLELLVSSGRWNLVPTRAY